jgi:hypothetical protein
MQRKFFGAGLLAATLTLATGDCRADEGGVPFWLSGGYASFVAVPLQPGWYIPTQFYYYEGGTHTGKTFQRGESLYGDVHTQLALVFLSPTWVPNEKWFGGTPSFTLTFGGGWSLTTGTVSAMGPVAGSASQSDNLWGFADLYPEGQIAWNSGNHNWMGYMTGDLPVGAYKNGRLANIGLGHTAYDLGGAYTFLSNTTGTETSWITGFTFNGMNPDTYVQSGIDWHLDYDISQFLSQNWQVGVVGYVYYQLTNDSGIGNLAGSNQSGVAAVGGELGYAFSLAGLQWYANARAYGEFWAQNRAKGFAIFGTISIPLGGGPKKASAGK